jgi:hypothetical protein
MFFKKIPELINKITTTKELNIFDKIRPIDYIGSSNNKKTIKGVVEIYDKQKNLMERTNNLVVYNGREFAASKIFGIGDYTDWNITHFGIGKGGTSDADPTTKIGPEDNDTDLYEPLVLNKSDSSYLANGVLKPIGSENIYIEQDPNTDNHYTRIRIELTIDPTLEPDLLTPAKINEAALFYTDSNGNYRIFAHVTFTDKYIEQNEKLYITWYILF